MSMPENSGCPLLWSRSPMRHLPYISCLRIYTCNGKKYATITHMIFAKRFAAHGHTREFTIEHSAFFGWIAREQNDSAIRTSLLNDWRRVEVAMVLFELKASELLSQGWSETS